MPERSPILSAKNDGRQIGYIEGNEVFDLLGRRRASSNGRTGNLCALDSGKIIGHVSLQGKFVGMSWIADELFSISDGDTHKEAVRREGFLHGPGVAGDIFKPRDAEAASVVHGNGEPPRPSSSERDEPTAELPSKSDGNRAAGFLNGPGGSRDAKAAPAVRSVGEAPSPPPPSEQYEPTADLSSKSGGDTYQNILRAAGFLNGPGVAAESFEPRDVEAPHAVRSIGETSSPPASEQGEPAAELFSKSWMATLTRKAVRKEGYLNGPGLVVAGELLGQRDAEAAYGDGRGERSLNGPSLTVVDEIFGRRDVEAAYADNSSGQTPSPPPPSKQDEPAADLSSKFDDNTHQDIGRRGGSLNGPSLTVADEIIEPRDAEAAYADRGSGETPSQPPPFEQREAPTELFSKSDGNTQPDGEESLSGLGPAVAGDIIEPRDVADRSIGEMFSLLLSQQGEPAAELFPKFDINTQRQTLREEDPLNGPNLAGADEIIEPRDVEAGYADHGSGEMPSPPPPSERREAAADTISPEERTAPDPTADFFSVDMERAVEMVRRKLGGESYNNDPGPVVVGELSDPTAAFFSVDEERAVGIVRREFGSDDYLHDPGLVAAGELRDPTKDFFSVDVDRAVEMVRRALEKGALERAGPGS